MKKKEVIYYTGHAMGPPDDCPVELLENNKGRTGFGVISEIPEYKILSFWDRIELIGVWNWKKKYNPKYEICDGYSWELKLRDRNGRVKYCTGHQSFPRKFKDLIKELDILFGSNIDI